MSSIDLHIGFEQVAPYPLDEEWIAGADAATNPALLLVGTKKMFHPKTVDPETGETVPDQSRLVYNPHLTLSGIPSLAYDFSLGSRSGIDWIIDRYYVRTDSDSGIVNDPNQWALEHDDPRYIVELVGRVVSISMRSLDIIDELPSLNF